jgi:hypothetical protein
VYEVVPSPAQLLILRARAAERALVLAGELRTGVLCDVASFVGHAGYRAELLVIDGHALRSVYFEKGEVLGAQSTYANERIGRVLYRHGALDETQVEACALDASRGAVHFGEAAVSRGYITRERLFAMMTRQCEEIFYGALLAGSGGMFYVLDGFDETELSARQQLSISALVREGVRRMHETRYFRARIPSDAHVPARLSLAMSEEVEASTARVFAAVDGRRSVADIGRNLGLGEFEITRALFQLLQGGHVAVRPPRTSTEAAVGIYNDAIALVLRELDAMDEGDQVRTQLAEFAESKGLAALFLGAGPDDDGSLDVATVVRNASALGAAALDALPRRLFEYASYALFLARPHLRRADQSQGKPRITQRVARMLEPIGAPSGKAGAADDGRGRDGDG